MDVLMVLRKCWFSLRWEFLRTSPFRTRYFGYDLIYLPKDHVIARYAAIGAYEKDLIEFLGRTIRPDSIICDIGANIGMFTLAAARFAPNAIIHCFEPSPVPRHCLEQSVERNNLRLRVIVNQQAVSAAPGKMNFHRHGGEKAAFDGLRETDRVVATDIIVVPVTTIDNYIAQSCISCLDIIKIDTEGAELFVLRGALQTLLTLRPIVIFEVSLLNLRPYGIHPSEIEELFHAVDYQISTLDGTLINGKAFIEYIEKYEEFVARPI